MLFDFEVDAWSEEKGFHKVSVKAMRTANDTRQASYRLTHERSGLCVTPGVSSSDAFALLELAVEYGAIADWTQSAPDLERSGVGGRCGPLLAKWVMAHECEEAGGPPKERSAEAVARSEVSRAVH
mgnify:CR=1 FL=1